MKTLHPPSMLYRTGMSFGLSLMIFSLGAVVEITLHYHGFYGIWEWLDNAICALVTGLVVFAYEQRQYQRIRDRLRIIAEMNHHVRNALQPILYAPQSSMNQEQQVKLVRDCVGRIQWALQEVLPSDFGEGENPAWPMAHPRSKSA